MTGMNWTCKTFMLGGSRTPSGGYTSVGAGAFMQAIPGRSGNLGQLGQLDWVLEWMRTCTIAVASFPFQRARTVVVPPLVVLEVNLPSAIEPSVASSTNQLDCAVTSVAPPAIAV